MAVTLKPFQQSLFSNSIGKKDSESLVHTFELPSDSTSSSSDDEDWTSRSSLDGNTSTTATLSILNPLQILNDAFGCPKSNDDIAYWWSRTGPIMDKLLGKAGYSITEHIHHLLFFYKNIVPLFGPRPPLHNDYNPSPSNAPWQSFLTDDFSPFEPSWNLSGDSTTNTSTIRFGIEPIGHSIGRPNDPYNQETVQTFINSPAARALNIDSTLFTHFASEFFLPPQTTLPSPPNEHTTQSFLAFDLAKSPSPPTSAVVAPSITAKAYFFPHLQSHLRHTTTTTPIITDALLHLALKDPVWGTTAVLSAIRLLNDWLRESHDTLGAKAEMLSVDCVRPHHDARIKIYVRIRGTAWETVRDAYSLGGRLTGTSVGKGVEVLGGLWRRMFDVRVGQEGVDLPVNGHRTAGTIFNFEIRPGMCEPEPKVYLPVRHYVESDRVIAERFAGFLGELGWEEWEKGYVGAVEDLFPNHPLSESTGTHTYISFSYKETKGVYMTMYYSPRVYSVQ